MLSLASRIIWVSASLANLAILSALIRVRAWRTYTNLWYIKLVSIFILLAQDAHYLYPTTYAHWWRIFDMLQLLAIIGILYEVMSHQLRYSAEMLPPCYFFVLFAAAREYFSYQSGAIEQAWIFYYMRTGAGILTAFLLALSLWRGNIGIRRS